MRKDHFVDDGKSWWTFQRFYASTNDEGAIAQDQKSLDAFSRSSRCGRGFLTIWLPLVRIDQRSTDPGGTTTKVSTACLSINYCASEKLSGYGFKFLSSCNESLRDSASQKRKTSPWNRTATNDDDKGIYLVDWSL
jgi:hypothetical protein